jgi:benzodiazapine receptor
MTSESTSNSLQWVNIANLGAYLLNVLVTYGVGVSGKFPTNAELSAKYQTLVTPAGYAFSIWGIIFTAQLIWAVAQMLPKYRSKELVVHGVGYYYVAVCLAQIIWTFTFTAEQITLSLFAMLSILAALLKIITTTSKMTAETTGQYWLFKFPFEIHAGWIMAASLVNANVVLVAWNISATTQVTAAWFSLTLLAVASVYFTFGSSQYYVVVVPVVLAWASYAISVELSSPKDSIVAAFAEETIQSVMTASRVLVFLVLGTVALRVVYQRIYPSSSSSSSSTESADPDSYNAIEDN